MGPKCRLFLISAICSYVLDGVVTQATTPGYTFGPVPLNNKPAGDDKTYQYTILNNGLKVLNVLEERIERMDKFMIVATVSCGSFYNQDPLPGLPNGVEGLAHFLEHAMFLGSKNSTRGLDQFLVEHGGESNAFTTDESTTYYFTILSTFSEAIVEQVGQFFMDPLLNCSAALKEVSAVTSEHLGNVGKPMWQELYLLDTLAQESSPQSHFGTGDDQTLKSVESSTLCHALKTFYSMHYCPPRTKLLTIGPQNLSSQLELVNRSFGNWKPTGRDEACIPTAKKFVRPEPYPSEHLGKMVCLKEQTPTDPNKLWMFFPTSSLAPWANSAAVQYMQYLVEYKGNGSMRSVLRDKLGLCEDLEFKVHGNSAGEQMIIMCQLVGQEQKNVSSIVDAFLSYIAWQRRRGIDQHFYGSLLRSLQISWDWSILNSQTLDQALAISEAMLGAQNADDIFANPLFTGADQWKLVYLLGMFRLGRMNVLHSGPNVTCEGTQKPLPHYGTMFTERSIVESFGEAFVKKAATWPPNIYDKQTFSASMMSEALASRLQAQPGTFFPPREIRMPDPTLLPNLCASAKNEGLTRIQTSKGERLFRRGWYTRQPRVQMVLKLVPDKNSGPGASFDIMGSKRPQGALLEEEWKSGADLAEAIRLAIGTCALQDQIETALADFNAMGVEHHLQIFSGGFYISLNAYAPLMQDVERDYFKAIAQEIDLDHALRWSVCERNVLNSIRPRPTENELANAFEDIEVLTVERKKSKSELDAEIAYKLHNFAFTTESAQIAINHIRSGPFSSSRSQSLVVGSTSQASASQLVDDALTILNASFGDEPTAASNYISKIPPEVSQRPPRIVRLKKAVEVRSASGNNNNFVVVAIPLGILSIKEFALYKKVLEPMYRQTLFDECRTKMELGYQATALFKAVGNTFMVLGLLGGSKKSVDGMAAAIEYVNLKAFPEKLAGLTEEKLSTMLKSSMSKQTPRPQAEMSDPPISILPVLDSLKSSSNSMSDEVNILMKRANMPPVDGLLTLLHSIENTSIEPAALNETWHRGISRPRILIKYGDSQESANQPMTKDTVLDLMKEVAQWQPDEEELEKFRVREILRKAYNKAVLVKPKSSVREILASEGGYYNTKTLFQDLDQMPYTSNSDASGASPNFLSDFASDISDIASTFTNVQSEAFAKFPSNPGEAIMDSDESENEGGIGMMPISRHIIRREES